jgi:AcrR family transcriptional regulator
VPKRNAAPAAKRTNDPERTKADIIAVATQEFSENGYSGARVDEIAERTKTSKRMIYYYFGSKDGLYREVLLTYYAKLRGAERDLHLDELPPLEAMERLAHFTCDWHMTHGQDIRLVMVENIHRARHLASMTSIEPVNTPIIALVKRILERGVQAGVMRAGVDPLELYLSIAALSFFNVSNRSTVKAIFGYDMGDKAHAAERRKSITDMVLRSVVSDLAILETR